jgi:cytochrome P450 PksS
MTASGIFRVLIDNCRRTIMNDGLQAPLFTPGFWADPFPFFARLRAEKPVYRTMLSAKNPMWLVTRYEDVQRLLKDERFSKHKLSAMTPEQLRRQPWVPPMFRPLERNMLDLDPPDHTRLRSLVHRAFTPRLVDRMRNRVQDVADGLLARAEPRGELDLIGDYALPLTMTIITEILGVPIADQDRFRRWSKAIVSVNQLNQTLSVLPAVWGFTRYLRRFFRRRRAQPGDDLTSALIQAEEEGERLSEDELMAMVFLLLVAGHETTVNLIGNGMLALLQHPDQLSMLQADPSLMKNAIEELLRFSAPVFLTTERYPIEDVTIQGVTIPRGEYTFAAIGSANRDASVFSDPDRLDISRTDLKHLEFGLGVHYCLGAPLARLEANIALATLLRRLPGLRLAVPVAALRWRRSLILRGLEALPLCFHVR